MFVSLLQSMGQARQEQQGTYSAVCICGLRRQGASLGPDRRIFAA